MKKFYKNPRLWLYSTLIIISIVICLYNASMLFAIWGPPYIISAIADSDDNITIAELWDAFNLYAKEGAKEIKKNEQLVFYWFISRTFLAITYIVTAVFIILRKSWSRLLLLVLIAVNAILAIIYMIMDKIVNFENYFGSEIDTIIYYLVIIIFFTRSSVIRLFNESSQAQNKLNET